jgi:hypothetical protein
MTPAPGWGGRDVLSADAYELFWDCLENDGPAWDDSRPTQAEDPSTDAYRRYWELSDD